MQFLQKDWTLSERFEKKGNLLGSVSFFESNFTNVSSKTWWIDNGANVHVTNSVHDLFMIKTVISSVN